MELRDIDLFLHDHSHHFFEELRHLDEVVTGRRPFFELGECLLPLRQFRPVDDQLRGLSLDMDVDILEFSWVVDHL